MDLTVETGVGYRPAEHTEEMPIGVIPVDAIFSPVRRVNFTVSDTRVGQMTNFDRLTLEVETDGTTTPQAAVSQAAQILVNELTRFAEIGRAPRAAGEETGLAPVVREPARRADRGARPPDARLQQPEAEQHHPGRPDPGPADDEFLRMRNFGKKSLDELKERLELRGFIGSRRPASDGASDESDLPASAELDEAAAAELDRGGLADAAPDRRPPARPEGRPPGAHALQPGRRHPALREGEDHRGEGQGGPRPGGRHDHAAKRATSSARRALVSADAARAAHRREADGRGPTKYADRASGYTRIIKIGPRLGDAAPIVQIELV